MKASFRVALLLVAGTVALATPVALALDRWLAADGDEWAATVRIGPVERRWQVARVMRVATLPVVARALDGRSVSTPVGRWTVRRSRTGATLAECAPCVIRHRALGGEPLRLSRLALELDVARGDDYAGRFVIGREPALPVSWRVRLDRRGLVLDASAHELPIAALLAAVEPQLPELGRAHVEGTFGFTLRYGGDPSTAFAADAAARWIFEPRIDGLRVRGLGTEALATAALPARCDPSDAPLRGWLPIAVLAAEDQRFATHAGFEPVSLGAALMSNARASGTTIRGGSTLTQQLAKLVYTGDDRDPVRKLRELLYAVEMEETLGKARILQIYLAIAPWGPGVCGAERAARLYFGKPAARVDPLEAAWLAGLLRNPGTALRATVERCGIDAQRTAWVLDQMRPMALWRRNYWLARAHTLRPLPAARSRCPLRVADALPTGVKPITNK